MQVYYFVFLAVLSCVSAAPKDKRSPYPFFNPYFPFGGFGGFGRPFAGAYSGVGLPIFSPWMPFVPDFTSYTEWYKGPNICKEEKVVDEPDEMKQFASEGGSQFNFDFNHESQSCRGDNNVYMCMNWDQTSSGSRIKMVKYSCCHGYTRATDGSPGCVEKEETESKTVEEPKALPQKEKFRYNIYQGGSTTSAVGKVPAQ